MRKNESELVEKSLRDINLDPIVRKCFFNFFKGTTTVKMPGSLYNSETQMLCFTSSPEEKRKIIGDTFMKVTNELIKELKLNPEDVYLAQGTLRPDLIESASKTVSSNADTIKTHHNDTEMVRYVFFFQFFFCKKIVVEMTSIFLNRKLRDAGRVVEPLRDFHKDEVRKLGLDLGLPEGLVQRHPFPGPGLAIRILCAEEPYIEKDYSETQV